MGARGERKLASGLRPLTFFDTAWPTDDLCAADTRPWSLTFNPFLGLPGVNLGNNSPPSYVPGAASAT